ncbi:chemerin-like receptor 2 [Engystomops pustulosus]|uniref:chemerin-like receptor 2 n=1 Tax=Engystomops pustulosus TaxID=76066 RepID=UPI003AFB6B96
MENYSSLDPTFTWKEYCNLTDREDGGQVHVTSVVSAVIVSLVFLLGPTVNGFVLWIQHFMMEKKFRTIVYLHLFIAGFIFSVFQLLDMVYFALDLHWPFGSFMCRLNGAVFHLYMFVSSLILALFSIDYCLLILHTFRYFSRRTKGLAMKELLATWIFSLGVSVPYFIFKNTYDCQSSTKCLYGVLHNEKVQYQSIVTTAFVLGFFIPFLVIISCFLITVFHHRKKTSRYTTRLKVIYSIQMSFVLLWLPHHVFSFLSSFTSRGPLDTVIDTGLHLSMALASMTSCVNPLIYAFICPDFKEAFSQFFQKKIRHWKANNLK